MAWIQSALKAGDLERLRPFDYDYRGNIISEGQPFAIGDKRYDYDARGHLVQASLLGGPISATINHVVNGFGQRVFKQFRDGNNVRWEFAVMMTQALRCCQRVARFLCGPGFDKCLNARDFLN